MKEIPILEIGWERFLEVLKVTLGPNHLTSSGSGKKKRKRNAL
jgi:hypothetical protein